MKWLRNVNLGLATRWRSSTPLNLRDCWPITAQKPWAGVSVRWEEWGWGGRLTTLYAVHTVTWPLVGAFPQYGGGSSCSDGLLLTFEYVVRVVTWRGILTDETFQRTWKNKERKKKTEDKIKTTSQSYFRSMADRGADLATLPKEVKDQLAELELELSEGNAGDGVGFIPNGGSLTIDVPLI